MTNAVSLAQQASNGVSPGFRNRIINGSMVIDQRNAGASMTSATNGSYSLDRWGVQNNSGASRFTLQQNAGSVTPPVGFSNYLGITSTSAYSLTSGDVCGIFQNIEGLNVSDLAWGTANAKTVTLSFWVRSSLTGTFGGALQNSGGSRTYPFSYTISAANTWEQKSVTIAGDTSGTWLTTNGIGIALAISIGAGSTYLGTAGSWSSSNFFAPTGQTSVVGTNGATFYITGVQLEVGSTATSFDYRPYGTELQLCQRYCYAQGWVKGGATYNYYVYGNGFAENSTIFSGTVVFPTTMRGEPSVTSTIGNTFFTGFFTPSSAATYLDQAGTDAAILTIEGSGGVSGKAGRFMVENLSTSYMIWSAEL